MRKVITLLVFAGFLAALSLAGVACDSTKPSSPKSTGGTGGAAKPADKPGEKK